MKRRKYLYGFVLLIMIISVVLMATVGKSFTKSVIRKVGFALLNRTSASYGLASGRLDVEILKSNATQARLSGGDMVFCTANASLRQQLIDIAKIHQSRMQIAIVTLEYRDVNYGEAEWERCLSGAKTIIAITDLGYEVTVASNR